MTVRRYILALIALALLSQAPSAAALDFSMGLYGHFMPSMGGNGESYLQQQGLQSSTGMDGLNRTRDGASTTPIQRMLGAGGGLYTRVVLFDYFTMRIGYNYTQSVYGGSGTTVVPSGATYQTVAATYAMTIHDVPITVGLSISFWKDVRVSLSGGIAPAYAAYKNKFVAEDGTIAKGEFAGIGYPLVVVLDGEYFINQHVSFISMLSYYNGATPMLTDKCTDDGFTDYARINLGGFRFALGLAVHW